VHKFENLTAAVWASPLAQQEEEPAMNLNKVRDQETTGPDEGDIRVLFVEDDPAVAQMYKLKLELDGYAVEVATDGLQAVAVATASPPDLIFLDIRLPKMDGLGVLETLRQDDRTKKVPVVILSNYSERELVDRGLKLGALDYLIKSQTTPARVAGGVVGWLRP
jgi:CheY-like chemotaxis protein